MDEPRRCPRLTCKMTKPGFFDHYAQAHFIGLAAPKTVRRPRGRPRCLHHGSLERYGSQRARAGRILGAWSFAHAAVESSMASKRSRSPFPTSASRRLIICFGPGVYWGSALTEYLNSAANAVRPQLFDRTPSKGRADMSEPQAESNGQVTRVTVWNEFVHERRDEAVRAIYPDGMHRGGRRRPRALPGGRREPSGLPLSTSPSTASVVSPCWRRPTSWTWWGYCAHDQVSDEVVDRVVKHVLQGMGLVPMHSAHYSKVFKRLMGTGCGLRWRNAEDRELVLVGEPRPPYMRRRAQFRS